MKAKKIVIISLIVLVAILLTSTICAVYANSTTYDEPTETPLMYSKWMSYIAIGTKIKDIAIPGSHDAGAYDIPYLGATQDKDVATQLQLGVRYLDLRVTDDDGILKIYHGPFIGVELEPILRAVKEFITANPTELIILDFQHFANSSQSATKTMIDTIITKGKCLTKSSSLTDSEYIDSLKYTSSTRGKVLVFWGSDSDSNMTDNRYIFKRNNDNGTRLFAGLHSPYESSLNKGSSNNYIEQGLPQYINTYNTNHGGKGLFVLQGQLTDGMIVFGPQFRERTHNDNMNAYIASLTATECENINIVMRDFVDGTKVSLILQLNVTKDILVNSDSKVEEYTNAISDYLEE